MKKPKMRKWLVTTTMVAFDVRGQPGQAAVICEINRRVLDSECDPAATLMMQYQLAAEEIVFVPKARGKKRGKRG